VCCLPPSTRITRSPWDHTSAPRRASRESTTHCDHPDRDTCGTSDSRRGALPLLDRDVRLGLGANPGLPPRAKLRKADGGAPRGGGVDDSPGTTMRGTVALRAGFRGRGVGAAAAAASVWELGSGADLCHDSRFEEKCMVAGECERKVECDGGRGRR
jgi:hypothetical protein